MSGNEKSYKVEVKIEKTYDITDEIIDVIIEGAGYGIAYWADELTQHSDRISIHIPEDGYRVVSHQKLAEALVHIGTRNSPNYVDQYAQRTLREIEDKERYPGGDIDSDLADVIVQIALFGEVIYG